MRRLVNYLINNIREHFMLYIVLWSLLAIIDVIGNDSNLLIVFYVQIMPDDFVMQLHRF